jgi:hypothetical protein
VWQREKVSPKERTPHEDCWALCSWQASWAEQWEPGLNQRHRPAHGARFTSHKLDAPLPLRNK